MNNNLTEVVFILDRSGSMCGLEADTIGGFNSMLQQQRQGEGQVYISTILFDDKAEVLLGLVICLLCVIDQLALILNRAPSRYRRSPRRILMNSSIQPSGVT